MVFPAPFGPEEPDDLAGPDLDRYLVDDAPTAVELRQPIGAQQRGAPRPFIAPPRRPSARGAVRASSAAPPLRTSPRGRVEHRLHALAPSFDDAAILVEVDDDAVAEHLVRPVVQHGRLAEDERPIRLVEHRPAARRPSRPVLDAHLAGRDDLAQARGAAAEREPALRRRRAVLPVREGDGQRVARDLQAALRRLDGASIDDDVAAVVVLEAVRGHDDRLLALAEPRRVEEAAPRRVGGGIRADGAATAAPARTARITRSRRRGIRAHRRVDVTEQTELLRAHADLHPLPSHLE